MEIRDAGPEDVPAITAIQNALLDSTTYEWTEAQFEVDDLYVRAEAILRSNRRDRAVEAFEEILGRRPDDTEAVRRLAGLHYSMMQYGPALEYAERLATMPGSEAEGHRLAGVIHHDTSSPEPAVASFERVLALDPKLETVPDDAKRFFWYRYALDLIAENPGVPRYPAALIISLNELGKQLTKLGQLPGAEAAIRRALELARQLVHDYPEVAAYQEILARVYVKLGQGYGHAGKLEDLEEACRQTLACFERLARAFPSVPRYQAERFRGLVERFAGSIVDR